MTRRLAAPGGAHRGGIGTILQLRLHAHQPAAARRERTASVMTT
jgi:hypothetical protein